MNKIVRFLATYRSKAPCHGEYLFRQVRVYMDTRLAFGSGKHQRVAEFVKRLAQLPSIDLLVLHQALYAETVV
jgi:hypothetical protein